MKVCGGGEQLYVGGAVASGFAAALEYDRAASCDPFFRFCPEKASGVRLSGC
jgi:hypothetical protein